MIFFPFSQLQTPEGINLEQVIRCSSNAVILNDRQEVLMMLRDDYPVWTSIGGNVESDERFEDALHREVKEETGLEIEVVKGGYDFFSPLGPQRSNFACVRSYLCRVIGTEYMPMLQDEGIRLDWISQDSFPRNIPPKNLIRIKETIHGKDKQSRVLDYLPDMKQFSESLKKEDIYCFDFWFNHPNVKTKKTAAALGLK